MWLQVACLEASHDPPDIRQILNRIARQHQQIGFRASEQVADTTIWKDGSRRVHRPESQEIHVVKNAKRLDASDECLVSERQRLVNNSRNRSVGAFGG